MRAAATFVEVWDGEVMAHTMSDYAALLGRAGSFGEALDGLFEISNTLGYTQVLYAYLPVPARMPNGQWLPLKLNVRNFPAGWERGWEQFMSVDPYYRACFDGTLPIEWAEVQRRETLLPSQQAAWRYLGDFGLSRGVTFPVHLPFGRFAVVSAIADRSCHNWEEVRDSTREIMFQLTHFFHKTVQEKHFEDQVDTVETVHLSPRELECLRWAAAGKTSPEIAVILSRSVETVRLHIKNAIIKLNASNRAQAVASAVQLGLLQPPDAASGRYP